MTEDLLDHSEPDLPNAVELTEVPFFPQDEFQCGPAALATVLVYRGAAVTPQQLAPEVYVPAREGSFQVEMVAAARSRDMVVYPIAQSLRDLVGEVAAGNPVLVLQNLGMDWAPVWHYAVVVGYNLKEEQIILRSATTQRYMSDMGPFERTWERSKYWGIVVLTPDQLPARAEEFPYIKAVQSLEEVGHTQSAWQGYQTALRQWPRSALAWMGLGNTAFQLKHHHQAALAFRQLISALPQDADGWNNLAYALQADQCPAAALQAAQCAANLSPDDTNVQATLNDMSRVASMNRDAHEDAQRCAIPSCPLQVNGSL